jgi:hypothetical protein
MAGGRVAVAEQALADEQRRDAVTKADLDGPRRAFAHDPLAQRLTLGGANGDGEQVVRRAVGPRDHRAVTEEPLDHLPYLAQGRVLIRRVGGIHPGRFTRAGWPDKPAGARRGCRAAMGGSPTRQVPT